MGRLIQKLTPAKLVDAAQKIIRAEAETNRESYTDQQGKWTDIADRKRYDHMIEVAGALEVFRKKSRPTAKPSTQSTCHIEREEARTKLLQDAQELLRDDAEATKDGHTIGDRWSDSDALKRYRRTLKTAAALEIFIGEPSLDADRLARLKMACERTAMEPSVVLYMLVDMFAQHVEEHGSAILPLKLLRR